MGEDTRVGESAATAHPERRRPKAGRFQAPAKSTGAVTVVPQVAWARVGWALGIATALVVVVWLGAQLRNVSVPVLVAFVIAYLADPVVGWLQRRGLGRTWAIVALIAAVVLVGVGLVWLIGPRVVRELGELPRRLQELLARLAPWLEHTFNVRIPGTVAGTLAALQEHLATLDVGQLVPSAGKLLQTVFGRTASFLGSLAGVALTPIFAFIMLRHFDDLVQRGRMLVPQRYRPTVAAHAREIDALMSGFVRGQLIVAGVLAVLYAVGLSIVGLPLALVVGLVAGIGNLIPYVGTLTGLVLATLMAVLHWHGVGHLLLVYAVFAAVQALEGWIITPQIVGSKVELSPLWVLVAVLAFGELFGFFGILIAVPLAAIVKILLRELVAHYRVSSFYLGG